MAAAHRSSNSASGTSGGSTSIVVTKPAGTVSGDYLVAVLTFAQPATSVAAPAGWTMREGGTWGADRWTYVFTKRADGSETSTYTFTYDSFGFARACIVECVSGVDSSLIDPVTRSKDTGSSTSATAPSVNGLADGLLIHIVSCNHTAATVAPPSGFTEQAETTDINVELSTKVLTVDGATGAVSATITGSTDWQAQLVFLPGPIRAEATLQGVATITADPNVVYGAAAALQGVTTLTPDGLYVAGGNATLQGISRLTAEAFGIPFHDFTVYDAYIDLSGDSQGLLFHNDSQPETVALELQPTRSDVGNNPEEIRPEYGNFFAQSDFSHGAGQKYFHQPGRDPHKYIYSEGFDISELGRLSHLRTIAEAYDSTSVGRGLAQVAGLPFVAVGNRIRRGDGNFPGTWTEENPHVAEGDQTVEGLAAEGARLFAALGTNGVHIRSSAGTWSHFQPDGASNLNVTPVTRVAWLKNRLMIVGGTGSRAIYEIAASSTPTAIETLPEGWTFEAIFEAGGFIHACAVNVDAGLSRVHHYGLNTGLTAIEKKSSTPWPQGQLVYSGESFPGMAFLGVGKRNASGGYDPVLYQAVMNATGEMSYAEIREEEGAGSADLGIRAIATMGETVLTGWSLGSGAYGGARDGIAVYHIAREAFAHHLRKTGGGASKQILAIMPYKGRVLMVIAGDGLYYEDLANYVTTAQLVTSHADFNNAGEKVWDQIGISHDPLPAATSVLIEYGLQSFEVTSWTQVFTSDVDGSEGSEGRISNVKSRLFALRLTSTASASATPGFLGYSVRSLPSPATPEWALTRYVRLLSRDRKDEDGALVYQDPRALLLRLQDAIHSFVTFYEAGLSWTAWLTDVSAVEPAQPLYEETMGEARKDAFVVRLKMVGTR